MINVSNVLCNGSMYHAMNIHHTLPTEGMRQVANSENKATSFTSGFNFRCVLPILCFLQVLRAGKADIDSLKDFDLVQLHLS